MKEDLKFFANTIEDSAREQVNDLIGVGVFSGSKIRIMPDCHAGTGCTIGSVIKFEDRIVTYACHQKFMDGYVQKGAPWESTVLDDTKNRNHHEKYGYPLGTFIVGDENVIAPFTDSIPGIVFAWSFRNGFDVFLKDVTKATSVEAALKYYNLTWDNVIAFGDAGNDTPFIEPAAIGVAMGNSKDDVKAHADLVAPDCADDGVALELEKLGII